MSQPVTIASDKSKTRKMAMQMIIGALGGAGVTFLVLRVAEGSGFDLDDPSRAMALLIGLVFASMGLLVGLGAAMPGPGARLLNVEDEQELRELRAPLWHGAVVMVLIGVMMATLALAAGSDWPGIISRSAAAFIVAACVIGTALLTYLGRNDNDELMRSTAREGAAWGMYGCLTIFTVWGSLAHLGYAPWISPLGVVSALMAIQFVAIIAVCAKRGLLKPR